MLNGYKGIIFDLDGTLVDSMWIWEQIDVDFLEKRGHALPDDLQKKIEGMSITETADYFIKRFELDEKPEDIIEEWHEMAHHYYKDTIQVKDFVFELLEFFHDRNIPMGVGTSSSPELANAIIQSKGLDKYFKTIRTSCQVNKGKPAPDIFLKVAEDLAVDPGDCLVFEDTQAGVQAGKNAGMSVFAIYDKTSEAYKEDIMALADRYLHTYEELLAIS